MKKFGFTLIELLVVIAIVGILVAVGSISYLTASKQSRDTRRKTDLEQIRQALETYRAETSLYLTTAQGTGLLDPNYISVVPIDPKGSAYQYVGTTTSYSICSYLEIAPTAYTKPSACTMSCGTGTCNYGVTNP